MEFINFLRRLIALPFRIVAVVLLLTGLILAMPFVLIAAVFAPNTTDVSDRLQALLDILKKSADEEYDDKLQALLGMLKKSSDEDDDDSNSPTTTSIAF